MNRAWDEDYNKAKLRYQKLFWPITYQHRFGVNTRKLNRAIRKHMLPVMKKYMYESNPITKFFLTKGASHAR